LQKRLLEQMVSTKVNWIIRATGKLRSKNNQYWIDIYWYETTWHLEK
jgi:hypothetical protein